MEDDGGVGKGNKGDKINKRVLVWNCLFEVTNKVLP